MKRALVLVSGYCLLALSQGCETATDESNNQAGRPGQRAVDGAMVSDMGTPAAKADGMSTSDPMDAEMTQRQDDAGG